MNLDEALFAGETVRQSYNLRSRITRSNKEQTKKPQQDQGKARHGTQAPPGPHASSVEKGLALFSAHDSPVISRIHDIHSLLNNEGVLPKEERNKAALRLMS